MAVLLKVGAELNIQFRLHQSVPCTSMQTCRVITMKLRFSRCWILLKRKSPSIAREARNSQMRRLKQWLKLIVWSLQAMGHSWTKILTFVDKSPSSNNHIYPRTVLKKGVSHCIQIWQNWSFQRNTTSNSKSLQWNLNSILAFRALARRSNLNSSHLLLIMI